MSDEEDVIITSLNDDAIKEEEGKLTKKHKGKGKVKATLKKIAIGFAAVIEAVRSGLIKLPDNMLEWPVIKQIHALQPDAISNWFNGTLGLDASGPLATGFSSIIQYMANHPTLTVIGLTTVPVFIVKMFKKIFGKDKAKEK